MSGEILGTLNLPIHPADEAPETGANILMIEDDGRCFPTIVPAQGSREYFTFQRYWDTKVTGWMELVQGTAVEQTEVGTDDCDYDEHHTAATHKQSKAILDTSQAYVKEETSEELYTRLKRVLTMDRAPLGESLESAFTTMLNGDRLDDDTTAALALHLKIASDMNFLLGPYFRLGAIEAMTRSDWLYDTLKSRAKRAAETRTPIALTQRSTDA